MCNSDGGRDLSGSDLLSIDSIHCTLRHNREEDPLNLQSILLSQVGRGSEISFIGTPKKI